MNNKYALITGGTAGIGLDIARELAKQGHNILLTARREERLKEISISLKEELEFLTKNKINSISDKEIRLGNAARLLKDAVSSFDELYVSIDLDVVDPAFAPGVGNPEAVGITSRELYDMIISLEDKKIIGTDVVELNPSFDNGSTASLAAKMISTIIAMNI